MIEAGADEIPNDTMLEAIKTAHEEIKKICNFISDIKAEIGNQNLNINHLQQIQKFITK